MINSILADTKHFHTPWMFNKYRFKNYDYYGVARWNQKELHIQRGKFTWVIQWRDT